MNRDRWQQIQQIFQSALECEPGRRDAFLDEACAGDESLRKEVTSLLAHDGKPDSLFDVPAPQIILKALAEDQAHIRQTDLAGHTLSHYQIIEKIGEGGMGVVYRAEDSRLKRPVAIKLLPADRVADPERKKRFIKEARAASALNHPNIITIHDIDAAEGLDFIVMEYLAGTTLDRQLPRKGMPISKVLDLGIQMADALAAAHSAGIVHRDLKPSNVMVSESGKVKVLDFGLAKLVERTTPNADEDPTADSPKSSTSTEEGVIVGTVAYMSPEQAEGKKLDARSDIFSFGAVLYEMASGQRAFQGESAVSILASIIRGEPKQLGEIVFHLPAEFEKVVQRCLKKEPDRRFQSIADVRVELQEVKEQPDPKRLALQSVPPEVREPGWLRRWGMPAVALLVLIIVAGAVGWWVRQSPDDLPKFTSIPVTKTDGWEGQPALSPDGGRIAYTSNETGNLDIFVIGWRGGTPQNLTQHPAQDEYPAWFPDGSAILFASDRDGKRGIWKMNQLGRDEVLVIPSGNQPAVSPDGRQVAFTVEGEQGYTRIGVASLEQPRETRTLTVDDGPFGHSNPAWSPDGKSICYSARHNLWSIPVKGGTAHPLTRDNEFDSDPCWSPGGRFVYFTSRRGGTTGLWRQVIGDRSARRLTLGMATECHPSLSRDGRRLAYSTGGPQTTLIFRTRSSGLEVELSRVADDQNPSISPDNRTIAIISRRLSPDLRLGLLALTEEGGPAPLRRLTDQPGIHQQPRFSHNGKWIAYHQVVGTDRDIWVSRVSGDPPVRITTGPSSDVHPAWSPDDSQIAFASDRDGRPGVLGIWIMGIREDKPTGSPRRLKTPEVVSAYAPDWSPDGSRIAFIGVEHGMAEVWVASLSGSSKTVRVTDGAKASRVRWDGATGGWLVSGRWGESQLSIKSIPSSGSPPVDLAPPVVLGPDEPSGCFDLSYDARFLAFVRQSMRGDIWVLETEEGSF